MTLEEYRERLRQAKPDSPKGFDQAYSLRKAKANMFFDDDTMLEFLASERFPNDPYAPLRYSIVDGEIMYQDDDGNLQKEFIRPQDAGKFDEYILPNIIPASTFVADVAGGLKGATKGFEIGLKAAQASPVKHPLAQAAIVLGSTAIGGFGGNVIVGGVARTGRELTIDQFYNLPPEEIAAAAKDLGISSAFSLIPFGAGPAGQLARKFTGKQDTLQYLVNLRASVDEKIKEAAKFGITLTPAEAADLAVSGRALQLQNFLARQPSLQKIQQFYNSRSQRVRDAVTEFANTIGSEASGRIGDVNTRVAEAAKNAMNQINSKRKSRATKFYDLLRENPVSVNTTPLITSLNAIIQDPVKDAPLREAAQKFKNSLMVKRIVDGKEIEEPLTDLMNIHDRRTGSIEKIVRENLGTNIAGQIIALRQDLTKLLDDVSPEYNLARRIYDPNKASVDAAERSAIGRMSNFFGKGNDKAVARSVREIFNPDVSAQSLRNVKRILKAADPETWKDTKKYFITDQLDRMTKQTVEQGTPQFQKYFAQPRVKKMLEEVLEPEEFVNFYKLNDFMGLAFNRAPRGGSITQESLALEKQLGSDIDKSLGANALKLALIGIRLPGRIISGQVGDDFLRSIDIKQREAYYDALADVLFEPDAEDAISQAYNYFAKGQFGTKQSVLRGGTELMDRLTKPEMQELSPERVEKLMNEADQIQETESSIDLDIFDPLPTTPSPSGIDASLSPTVLPSDQDRELAMRLRPQAQGIAALV